MKKTKYCDKTWFDSINKTKNNYKTIRLIEKDKTIRETIKKPLIEIILQYYIPSDIIEYFLDEDEYMSDLEHVINEYLPNPEKDYVEKGDFSEIISSEHLIQNYNFQFPYIKIQDKPNSETSNHGDDLLGFKFNDAEEISEISLGEVKFRKDFSNYVFKDAHKQLKESYHPKPKSLKYIVTHVVKQKNKNYKQFINLLRPNALTKIKISHWIFCVTEKSHNNLDIHDETDFLNNLTLISFYLPNISPYIHEIYELSRGHYNE